MPSDYKSEYAKANYYKLKGDPRIKSAYKKYKKQVQKLGGKEFHTMESFIKSGAYKNYTHKTRKPKGTVLGDYGRRAAGADVQRIISDIKSGKY